MELPPPEDPEPHWTRGHHLNMGKVTTDPRVVLQPGARRATQSNRCLTTLGAQHFSAGSPVTA